jgi:hypothetical protein
LAGSNAQKAHCDSHRNHGVVTGGGPLIAEVKLTLVRPGVTAEKKEQDSA